MRMEPRRLEPAELGTDVFLSSGVRSLLTSIFGVSGALSSGLPLGCKKFVQVRANTYELLHVRDFFVAIHYLRVFNFNVGWFLHFLRRIKRENNTITTISNFVIKRYIVYNTYVFRQGTIITWGRCGLYVWGSKERGEYFSNLPLHRNTRIYFTVADNNNRLCTYFG